MTVFGLSTFIGALTPVGVSPFATQVAAEMHVSIPVLGQVSTAMSVVAALMGLLVGPIADRWGAGRMLVLGLLLAAAWAFASATVTDYTPLVCAALLLAFSRAMVNPCAKALAGTMLVGRSKQQMMSFTSATIAGGLVIGVPFLTTISGVVGWRGAQVILGAFVLGTAALAVLAVPVKRATAPTSGADASTPRTPFEIGMFWRPYREISRQPFIVALLVWSASVHGAAWAFSTYLDGFMNGTYGTSPQATGIAFALTGIGTFAGSLVAGKRLRNIPPLRLLIIATIASGLIRSLPILVPLPLFATYVLWTAAAVSNVYAQVIAAALLLDGPPATRSTIMASQQSLLSLGSAIGALLGGFAITMVGYTGLGVVILGLAAAGAAAGGYAHTRQLTPNDGEVGT
jgi:predicted MFS family arabinose efflux permease